MYGYVLFNDINVHNTTGETTSWLESYILIGRTTRQRDRPERQTSKSTRSDDERVTVSGSFNSFCFKLLATYHYYWLEKNFLGYLSEWEQSVYSLEGFTESQKATMMLSRETLDGIHMTG